MASYHQVEPGLATKLALFEGVATVGYTVALTIELGLLRIFIVSMLLNTVKILRPHWISSRYEPKAVFKNSVRYWGMVYLMLSGALCALTIWDLTDCREWEQWL